MAFVNSYQPDNASSSIVPKNLTGKIPVGLRVSPTELYFGAMVIGEDQLIRPFAVENIGKKTLRIESVTLEEGDQFELIGSAPTLIRPGEIFEMSVKYASTVLGMSTGLITIVTNEIREPYGVKLSGRVIGSTFIEALFDEVRAMIEIESITRANEFEAEAIRRQVMEATLSADYNAKFLLEQTARVNGLAAEASERQQLQTTFTGMVAGIATDYTAMIDAERIARTTAISAEAAARQALAVAVTNDITAVNANITAETNARVSAINAEAASREALRLSLETSISGVTTNVTALIDTEKQARITAVSAEASSRNALAARLDQDILDAKAAATAAVTAETNARVTAVSAETSARNAMKTVLDGNIAAATTTANNASTSAGAVAGRATTLEAQMAGTTASGVKTLITNETTARVSGDSANATSITNLTTTVSGNTASISSHQTSINGINAKYGITIDVNGYVSGYQANSGGGVSSFVFAADKFFIVKPGTGGRNPFDVNGDLNGVMITPTSISASKFSASNITVAMGVGSAGKIVLDGPNNRILISD